jgi:diaminopimelate epimerase
MHLRISKYHGTGNDFILIDNRKPLFSGGEDMVKHLCHRRFGVGADGLILLQNKEGYDFEMVYFNADGKTSSMCGNGGRCIAAFAHRLGIIAENATFLAADGPHNARILSYDETSHQAVVSLHMQNVTDIQKGEDYYFLNTGSPHYVTYVDDVSTVSVNDVGKKIRNSERFRQIGTNVNFVQETDNVLNIRTYERGVEEETWSCGTGVTAAALVTAYKSGHQGAYNIETPGGSLKVHFEKNGNGFKNIFLEGPAVLVFDGEINN